MGAVPLSRPGWTLAEMLVSLTTLGLVVGLASSGAAGQFRFYTTAATTAAARARTDEAVTVVSRMLWGASPVGGDILVARPDQLELHVAIGVAVACADGVGSIVIADDAGVARPLGAFHKRPEVGDRVQVWVADSAGAGWMMGAVTSVSGYSWGCAAFPDVAGTITVGLELPLWIPAGSVLTFGRRVRLRHYRASDDEWYLGLQEWEGSASRFSTTQPVAGPLDAPTGDPGSPGLRFLYRDRAGSLLLGDFDTGRIASIQVVTRDRRSNGPRPSSLNFATLSAQLDSSIATIWLRNAP